MTWFQGQVNREGAAHSSGDRLLFAFAGGEVRLRRGNAAEVVREVQAVLDEAGEDINDRVFVRAKALLADAHAQLGSRGRALTLLADVEQRARSSQLFAEAVRASGAAAVVLIADGRTNCALRRLKLMRRELERLMAVPDQATLNAAYDFARVSTGLGAHAVAEVWFERLVRMRDQFSSPEAFLRVLSGLARLRLETGLFNLCSEHKSTALAQFHRAARLGQQLAEQAEDEVLQSTGLAVHALTTALLGLQSDTPSPFASRGSAEARVDRYLACLVQVALAEKAAAEGAWSLAKVHAVDGLRLSESLGLMMLGIESYRLVALATHAQGDFGTGVELDRQWRLRWSAYEWSARVHTAELMTG